MMDVPDVLYVYWEPHFFGSNIKDGNRIKRTGLQSQQKVGGPYVHIQYCKKDIHA